MSLHEGSVPISGKKSENVTKFDGGSIDVARYISEEIQKSESRSVVISNIFTDYHAADWDSNSKQDSYLLLTPSCSYQEFDIVKSVKEQLKQLSSYPGWNPRARFVVTVMKICSEYNAEKLSQRILVELWNWKVVNSIILIPLTYASQSEAARGSRTRDEGLVMEAPALGLYTWFPYRGPNQCSVVDEAVLLDIWLMVGEGNFVSNSFLYPKKIGPNFNGCELRVTTILTVFTVEGTTHNSGNSTNIVYEGGMEIRLINLIIETMNMTTIFLPPVSKFRKIQDESGNYIGYTGLLMKDEADIAFGGVTRPPTFLLDVTTSYCQIKWEWYVPCPVKFPRWKSIFRIFSLSGWLSIFFAAILATFIVVFLATFGSTEYESFRRFVDAITDVWALILGVSISVMPRTIPLRFFFSAWVWYSLAMNTVFQAYLTTFLVDPGLEKSITNIEEVFTSGNKYGFPAFLFDHSFNDKTDPRSMEILKNRIDCNDVVTCLTWTARYRNISSICTKAFVDYFYYTSEFSGELRGYQPCSLKEMPVLVTDIVMVLQKGSPLLNRMNEIIGRLIESGILGHWTRGSSGAGKLRKATAKSFNTAADEFYVLNLNHMQSAFCLFSFGQGLGVIYFLTELLYFKMHLQRH
jgi:hypothetical protein